MIAAWRVAPSLEQLLDQLNRLAPARSKASDGAIGDAAHATRDSDHNPHLKLDGQAWVTARDFTHDPKGGLSCNALAEALRNAEDPRVKYVIWSGRIMAGAGGPKPWMWRTYYGANQHRHHLHLSVVADRRCLASTAWQLPDLITPVAGSLPVLRHGDRSAAVRKLQEFLTRTFPTYAQFEVTGYYGDQTKAAVREFQRRAGVHGSPLDGSIVGPATNYELAKYGYRGASVS